MEAVYIIRTRESIRLDEEVYKIGRTCINKSAEKTYPKGSVLMIQKSVPDANKVKKKLLQNYIEKFKQRDDLGIDYFEADYNELEAEFIRICCDAKYSPVKRDECSGCIIS